jgi:tetratricopeptide (TPR) repeat protein
MFSRFFNSFKARKQFKSGMEYLAARDFSSARGEFEEARKLDPHDDMTLLNLGQVYTELGEYEKAIEALSKAKELASPVNPIPEIYLGYAYYRHGKLDEANEALESALKIDIKHPAAHYYLGLVSLKRGRVEEATEHFEEVVSEKPTFIQARLLAIGEMMLESRAMREERTASTAHEVEERGET